VRDVESSPALLWRSFWRDPWCLLIVSAGLLLRWVLSVQRADLLLEDADGYLAHARVLLQLGRFAGPYTGASTAFRPPGFVILLAMPLWLGLSASAAVLVVQLAMSLCCCWATAALAVLFGLPRRLVLVAVAGVSCDPLLIWYSVQPMSEVPCAAVLSASLVLFLHGCIPHGGMTRGSGVTSGRQVRPWNYIPAATAGVFFACGGLIRPAVLLAAAFCFLAGAIMWPRVMWRGKVRSPGADVDGVGCCGARVRLKLLCAAVCGFAAGLFPWVLRNGLVFGSFIPATTHGGYTLALGNNPDFYRDVIRQPPGNDGNGYPWRGDRLVLWQRRTLREAELSGVRPGDERGLDRWYYRYALLSIRDDLAAFRSACVLRLFRFWAITGTGGKGSAANWLTGFWYLCWWCGLAAAVICRRAWRWQLTELLMWLCVAVFCGLHLVYWTDTRMRAPIMPLLIVLSLGGMWRGICGACRLPQSA
jgi:hypothetical protein